MHDLLGSHRLTTGPGWAAFGDPEQILHATLVLLLATLSGLVLAYHPVRRHRSLTAEGLDQRKTLIIYSVVGALIAIICTVAPSMAFVIFGIGGLMRFRTDVGEPKSTGATIMGTLIGLCWGLGLQLVAVIATLYFFVMIYVLEVNPVRVLTVGGLDLPQLGPAADAYREALTSAGCSLLNHTKGFKKGKLTFLVRLPKGSDTEQVARQLEGVPAELRGSFDWSE